MLSGENLFEDPCCHIQKTSRESRPLTYNYTSGQGTLSVSNLVQDVNARQCQRKCGAIHLSLVREGRV